MQPLYFVVDTGMLYQRKYTDTIYSVHFRSYEYFFWILWLRSMYFNGTSADYNGTAFVPEITILLLIQKGFTCDSIFDFKSNINLEMHVHCIIANFRFSWMNISTYDLSD